MTQNESGLRVSVHLPFKMDLPKVHGKYLMHVFPLRLITSCISFHFIHQGLAYLLPVRYVNIFYLANSSNTRKDGPIRCAAFLR